MATGIRSLIDTTRSYAAMPPGSSTQAFLQNKLATGDEIEKIAAALVSKERKKLRDAQNIIPEEQSVIEKMAGLGRIMPDPSIQPGVDPRNMMAGIMQEAVPMQVGGMERPMDMEMMGGVAELPVDDTFYVAEGGIIGFQDRGTVPLTEEVVAELLRGEPGSESYLSELERQLLGEDRRVLEEDRREGLEKDPERSTSIISHAYPAEMPPFPRLFREESDFQASPEEIRALQGDRGEGTLEERRDEITAANRAEQMLKQNVAKKLGKTSNEEQKDLAEFLQRLGLGIMVSKNPRFLGAASESALAAWKDIRTQNKATRDAKAAELKATFEKEMRRREVAAEESKARSLASLRKDQGRFLGARSRKAKAEADQIFKKIKEKMTLTSDEVTSLIGLRDEILSMEPTEEEYNEAIRDIAESGGDVKTEWWGMSDEISPLKEQVEDPKRRSAIEKQIEQNRVKEIFKKYNIDLTLEQPGDADKRLIDEETEQRVVEDSMSPQLQRARKLLQDEQIRRLKQPEG